MSDEGVDPPVDSNAVQCAESRSNMARQNAVNQKRSACGECGTQHTRSRNARQQRVTAHTSRTSSRCNRTAANNSRGSAHSGPLAPPGVRVASSTSSSSEFALIVAILWSAWFGRLTENEAVMSLPFFVYGTLLLGCDQPNTHHFLGAAERHVNASLPSARLFAFEAFPMMLMDAEAFRGESVRGQVVYVQEARYEEVLRSLDALEEFDPDRPDSSLYVRKVVTVHAADDDRPIECFTYVAKSADDVAGLPQVPANDWALFCRDKPAALAWWSEQERTGADVRQHATQ